MVEGFFGFPKFYKLLADSLEDYSVVVEIGTHLGKSAIFLADAIRFQNKKVEFYTIDIWPDNTYPVFMQGINSMGLGKYIMPIRERSEHVVHAFRPESVDCVFMDLEPSEEALQLWRQRLKPGGLLAGHDFSKLCVQDVVLKVSAGHYLYFKNEDVWVITK